MAFVLTARSFRGARDRVGRSLPPGLAAVPPAAGAIVMGTGIVSSALAKGGLLTSSRILLALTATAWAVIGVMLALRVRGDRRQLRLDAAVPGSLTAVAGTAVLGSRLDQLGWVGVASALLIGAYVLWIALLIPVLRHWKTPTRGTSFLLPVATQSLAVLAAAIAARQQLMWLLGAAIAVFALGLCAYVLVVVRFDLAQLASAQGEHWVAGGALAISTLAAAQITRAAVHLDAAPAATALWQDLAIVLWVASLVWIPVLVWSELRWPRPRYDVHRWSTVFPVGMYATSAFLIAGLTGVPAIRDFADVAMWAAVAVWIVVALGLVRTPLRSASHRTDGVSA